MKKIIFALAAVVALAACSKEEVLRVDRQAIAFGDAFVDNATRADYSDGQELTTFDVFGTVTGTAGTVNIFNGTDVYKTKRGNDDIGDTGTWWYDAADAQYWIPGASYNFVAVADATIWSDEQDSNKMPRLLHTKYSTTGGNIADMLYATATATVDVQGNPSANPVNFTFQHLLSKVKFSVTSHAEGGYHHNVTNITVANYSAGTYTIGATTPWAGTTSADVAFDAISDVTATTGAVTNSAKLLVPVAGPFDVKFTVDLYKGTTKLGTETKTISVTTPLLAGNSYNFTIDCKVGAPIMFGVEDTGVAGWGDDNTVTVQ